MKTLNQISEIRQQVKEWKNAGLSVAFVPTMGNLHLGHLTLVDEAFKHADRVVVSIYVNPMQFGANEDLDSYPRTLAADSDALIARGVNILYTPQTCDIYPRPLEQQTFVEVPELGDIICGETRPNHFRGVTTIVAKLFNIVQPDIACFGQKDFQQLFLIKRMVEDLSMPITIIGVPTVRENSGLAMSSRNGYLSESEKQQATALFKTLTQAKHLIIEQNESLNAIQKQAIESIISANLELDYFHILDADTLQVANSNTRHYVLLIAAFMSKARLIDNIHFSI